MSDLLARLGAAVGDLLSPQRQAEALIASYGGSLSEKTPFQAMYEIAIDVSEYRIFDRGSATVWSELETAHSQVASYLNSQVLHRVGIELTRGGMEERSSELELGLQAADVGAAVASKLYEEALDDRPAARGHAVKSLFARVCLNATWL